MAVVAVVLALRTVRMMLLEQSVLPCSPESVMPSTATVPEAVTLRILLLRTIKPFWLEALMPNAADVPFPMSFAVAGSPIVLNVVHSVRLIVVFRSGHVALPVMPIPA
ncbi:MAG TPA: hypothetical protein PK239_11290 [Chitinophagales bacterium]|nr:hypothetical protein [Chitinophagales bacterium]HRK27852.1 hypothetical protein [Chitinophagales bacterium]